MTNSGFKKYLEEDGSYTSAMIDEMFVSNLDLSYTFKWRGLKSATIGVTVYNLFNEEYESNGSCSMNFKKQDGKVVAYNGGWAWPHIRHRRLPTLWLTSVLTSKTYTYCGFGATGYKP